MRNETRKDQFGRMAARGGARKAGTVSIGDLIRTGRSGGDVMAVRERGGVDVWVIL